MFGKWVRRVLILLILVAILLFIGMAKYGWEVMGIKITSKGAQQAETKVEKGLKEGAKKVEKIGDEVLDVIKEEGSELGKTIKEQAEQAKDKVEQKIEEMKSSGEGKGVTEEDEKKLDQIIEDKSQRKQ